MSSGLTHMSSVGCGWADLDWVGLGVSTSNYEGSALPVSHPPWI